MSNYYVNADKLKEAIQKLESIEGKYSNASNKVNQSYRQISQQSGGRVSSVKSEIIRGGGIYDKQMDNVTVIKNCLRDILNETANMDAQAKREFESAKYDSKKAKLSEVGDWKTQKEQNKTKIKDVSKTAVKIVSKLIGEADFEGSYVVGPAVSLVGGIVLDEVTGKKRDYVDEMLAGGKTIGGVIGGAGKFLENSVNNLLKSKQISQKIADMGTETAKDIKTIGKGLGYAIDIGESLKSNYEEYDGDWLNPRMHMETMVEAGLSIGLSVALAPIGGPIWGPVASYGIDATFNLISKAVTGNDLGWKENTSNLLVDGAFKVAEVQNKVINNMANQIVKSFNIGKPSCAWAA